MNWIVRVGNWDSSNYSGIIIINGVNENGDAQVSKFFSLFGCSEKKGPPYQHTRMQLQFVMHLSSTYHARITSKLHKCYCL
jgi:hypothetical protein